MVPSTVLFHIQQMCQCLDDVKDMAEWISAVEETVIRQVESLAAVLDPVISGSDRENFDYEGNLD